MATCAVGFNFVYDQCTKAVSAVACRMGLAVTYSGMLCRFWRSSANVWRALTSTAVSGMIPDTHAKTVKTALPQVPHAHGPHHSSPMREADLRVPAVRAQGNAQVPIVASQGGGLRRSLLSAEQQAALFSIRLQFVRKERIGIAQISADQFLTTRCFAFVRACHDKKPATTSRAFIKRDKLLVRRRRLKRRSSICPY